MVKKTFDCVSNLGYKTLCISGCSFTYNNSQSDVCSWPYYLRDLAGFSKVIDSSLPGSGNYHIMNSLIWNLETHQPDISDTLVIVMWSGNNRDDNIVCSNMINNQPYFYFSNDVAAGISGGIGGTGNYIASHSAEPVKSENSRAVENFLYIVTTYYYLKSKKYKFLFLDYLDSSLRKNLNLTNDIEIRNYLDKDCVKKLDYMINYDITNIYKYAVYNNLLSDDLFHPSPNGHFEWTKNELLPFLKKYYNNHN